MLKDELLKNIGKTMNINTKRKTKYDFKNLKLVGVYYDEDYLETWIAKFDLRTGGLEIVIDGIESIEILD
ncbi:hypothetical protein [Sneathia sanguinegens]|uniref:hypothetical protein n=1 Tax=Sneathia sanguinegens TaxID=40543 RepID=UPI0008331A57|nr:hypothetical protein [Sneathia sanguinegens]